jgi:hypothetical protein
MTLPIVNETLFLGFKHEHFEAGYYTACIEADTGVCIFHIGGAVCFQLFPWVPGERHGGHVHYAQLIIDMVSASGGELEWYQKRFPGAMIELDDPLTLKAIIIETFNRRNADASQCGAVDGGAGKEVE